MPAKILPSIRFWAKVDKRGLDECWPWLGHRRAKGYGSFFDGTRDVRAHRYALVLASIVIPPGLEPDHTCGNPWCVNVHHLEMVTSLENIRRGRERARTKAIAAGVPATHNAKLTKDQVLAIRADPRGYRTIAKEYRMNPKTIQAVRQRKRYAHF
jgi:hypothetical protein